MKIIHVKTMQEFDRRTIEAGTPGKVLMQRAGEAVAREMLNYLQRLDPRHRQRVTVLAGKGNNGGDAFVAAAFLNRETGMDVSVYCTAPKEELKGDARHFAEMLPSGVPCSRVSGPLPAEALSSGTVLVDGLLGTGISGPLRSPYDKIIAQVNGAELPVFAIDIPSGLNGDTGEIATDAVQADLTVTMAFPKRGMMTPAGLRRCGELRCVDIGIPSDFAREIEDDDEAIFAGDAAGWLNRRAPDGHKGTFGHVLVAGGSLRFVGAPLMAGTAALRSGCGMVSVVVPHSVRQYLSKVPHALIVVPGEDNGMGCLTPLAVEVVKEWAVRTDCVVVGPGIGRDPETQDFMREILRLGLPLVIDADGLRHAANLKRELIAAENPVLTPHPGEMRALLKGLGLNSLQEAGRRRQARELAEELGATIILKGQGTVVADPEGKVTINTSGNNGLAAAGSGDVLSGMVGSFIAQGYKPARAARLAVFMHGRAAELSGSGTRALIADDLPQTLHRVFRELTPFS